VDQLITVSDVARTSYLAHGVADEQVTAIPNGIEPPPHSAQSDRIVLLKRLGLAPDVRLLLTVGRLTAQKGHRDLLAALPQIVTAHPKTLCLWLGDGPLRGELEAQINQQQLNAHVRLLGARKDVAFYLRAAELLVMPSHFEGMPLVLLEAMAAELPVVVTDVGGNPEVIRDGVHGRLVSHADPSALAAVVIEALDQPEMRAQWAAAAKIHFEQHFTAAQMAHRVDALYQQLILQVQAQHAAGQPEKALEQIARGEQHG
jgi:glycosyltransferase involved in cell wall biosynthesis